MYSNKSADHSLGKSVFLHLAPGAIITIASLGIGAITTRFGFPPVTGLLLSVPLVLLPFELGRIRADRSHAQPQMRQSLPWHQYVLWAFITIIVGMSLYIASSVFIGKPIAEFLKQWLPSEWFINDLEVYRKLPRDIKLITLALDIAFNVLLGPIIEELYFRGYLLPRLSWLGKAAPLINTVLFAIYHFWQPHMWFSIILLAAPFIYIAWWKQNIKLAILVHCTINFLGSAALWAYAFQP